MINIYYIDPVFKAQAWKVFPTCIIVENDDTENILVLNIHIGTKETASNPIFGPDDEQYSLIMIFLQ
jgi:hypothetical protein